MLREWSRPPHVRHPSRTRKRRITGRIIGTTTAACSGVIPSRAPTRSLTCSPVPPRTPSRESASGSPDWRDAGSNRAITIEAAAGSALAASSREMPSFAATRPATSSPWSRMSWSIRGVGLSGSAGIRRLLEILRWGHEDDCFERRNAMISRNPAQRFSIPLVRMSLEHEHLRSAAFWL